VDGQEGGLVNEHAILATRDLRVALGRRDVLRSVTLGVEAGSFIAVIGPNGAGKTSLLRALAGLVPSQGEILVDGRRLERGSSPARARRITYVPQHPVIPPAMTVEDYVLLGRTPHLGRFAVESAADRAIVGDALAALKLATRARDLVAELSGGERQRAILARAVAQQSPVLLLDEPTTALDLAHQHQVLELVDTLRLDRNITVLAAIHDLTLASLYATRIVALADGRVVANGVAADVITAENLARYWKVRAEVAVDAGGAVQVLSGRAAPVRRAAHA
jgi:iron complex transport system ATP-binding protein